MANLVPSHRHSILVVLLVLVLLLAVGTVPGLISRRFTATVNCPNVDIPIVQKAGWQRHPNVAYDAGRDSYTVVWEEGRDSNKRIYAKHLSAADLSSGTEFQVSKDSSAVPSHPRVAYEGETNRSVVVWEEVEEDARNQDNQNDKDIYGQCIDEVTHGNNFPIAKSSGDQKRPAIACGNGTCLVVWEHQDEGETDSDDKSDIAGRLISVASCTGQEGFYISRDKGRQTAPSVDYNSHDHEYLVVWSATRSGSGSDIYGRRLLLNDNRTWSNEFLISKDRYEPGPLEGEQREPDIAYDSSPANRHLVVWEDHRNGNAGIYGRFVNSQGIVPGDVRVAYDMDQEDMQPSIAYHPLAHEYLVAWEQGAGDSQIDIRGRRIASDGGLLGEELCIAPGVITDNQKEQIHASTSDGKRDEYLVVWQGVGDDDTTAWDVFGQRVAINSTPSVTVTPSPSPTFTPTPSRFYLPAISRDYHEHRPPPLCNGNFETGDFSCWVQNGELPRSVVGTIDLDNPFGSFAARLGKRHYDAGGPPLGRAWMYQSLVVPSSASKLAFKVFVYSYDIREGDDGRYDWLEVSIGDGDTILLSIGNPEPRTNCDHLWQSGIITKSIDLSYYGIAAGDVIQIWFSNWNSTKPECSTWSYVDDVSITP